VGIPEFFENPALLTICFLAVFLAGAFLSLLKTALACCRKSRLGLSAEKGDKNYIRALRLKERTGHYQASLRAGIIFLEIILGCLGGVTVFRILYRENMLNPLSGVLSFFLVSVITGYVFFILSETIPRAIARSAPEKITAAFSGFIKIFPVLFFPLLVLEKTVIKLMNLIPGYESGPGITEDEFRIALLEGERSGIVESKERTMVEGVFYLGDKPAGTFMTHRSEIKWLDINDSPEHLREIVKGTDQQHFPVAEGDLDKVSGIVSAQDILLALLGGSFPGLKSLMHTPCFIPETMPALKAFETFKKADTHCLFVMDEYGGFAGILSVRNLIEEITGQIFTGAADEDDIVIREDGSWLADGSMNIDSAAQAISLPSLAENADHSDYHTLAGFLLNLAGEIPRTGAYFDYNGYRFTVVDMDGNRIDRILIEKISSPVLP